MAVAIEVVMLDMKRALSTGVFAAVLLSGISLPIGEAAAQQRTVRFSGFDWTVRDTGGDTAGPGPNIFDPANVKVDSQGLHLILQRNAAGEWTSAEVFTAVSTGYGVYTWELATSMNTLASRKDAVLGLFTYANDRNELDFEVARFAGDTGNNGWHSVQPNSKSFFFSGSAWDTSVHTIEYDRSSVIFTSQGTNTSGDVSFVSTFGGRIPRPLAATRAHINLWFRGGPDLNASLPGGKLEVIIKRFDYRPSSG